MNWDYITDKKDKVIVQQYINKINRYNKSILLFNCIVYIFLFSVLDKNELMISIISFFFFISIFIIVFYLCRLKLVNKKLNDNKLYYCKEKIISKMVDYYRFYIVLGKEKIQINKNLYNSCKIDDTVMLVAKDKDKKETYKCFRL